MKNDIESLFKRSKIKCYAVVKLTFYKKPFYHNKNIIMF